MAQTRHAANEDGLTPELAEKYLEEMSLRWSYLVTRYGWEYSLIWSPNLDGMPDGCNKNVCAHTEYQFRYLQASIYFNLCACATQTKDKLEEILIHELTHLLLAPMRHKNSRANNELCTTMVSRLFVGLRNQEK